MVGMLVVERQIGVVIFRWYGINDVDRGGAGVARLPDEGRDAKRISDDDVDAEVLVGNALACFVYLSVLELAAARPEQHDLRGLDCAALRGA